jgi:hypothetical protein
MRKPALPGDPGYVQHTRCAHESEVITDAECRERSLLAWAVVRSRGIDDLAHCVDGRGHVWGHEQAWIDPRGRNWVGSDCTKCAAFTISLASGPAGSYEAFLDLLAVHAEHREAA